MAGVGRKRASMPVLPDIDTVDPEEREILKESFRLTIQKKKADIKMVEKRMLLTDEQNKKTKLQTAEREKELYPVGLLLREYDTLIAEIRSRLLSIPRKVAVILNPDDPFEVEKIVSTEIYSILDSLSKREQWLRK